MGTINAEAPPANGEAPPSVKKPGISFYAKLAVSLALVAYVFAKAGWKEFTEVLLQADPLFVVVSLILSPVLVLASVLKWRVLLNAKRIDVSVLSLFSLYLVGNFFNNVLPSNVGGDVVRGYKLGRDTEKFADVLASIFVERMSGFAVLLVFTVVAVTTHLEFLRDAKISAALAVALVGYTGVLWSVADPRPLKFVSDRLKLSLLLRVVERIRKFQVAVQSYGVSPRIWGPVLALSVLFYLLAVANVYFGCLAFSVRASFPSICVAVPVILIVSSIPISLGGIGLTEWGFYVAFEHVGLPGPVGLAVSLFIRAEVIVFSSLGGIFYLRWLGDRGCSKNAEAKSERAVP